MYRYFILFCLIASQADAQSIVLSGGDKSSIVISGKMARIVSPPTPVPMLSSGLWELKQKERLEDLEYRLDFLESSLNAATEKPVVVTKPSVELVIHPKKQRRYLAMFTADYCGHCRLWKRNEKNRIERAGFQVVEYDMGLDSNGRKYGDSRREKRRITSLPAFVVIDSDTGEWVSEQIVGSVSADTLIPMLGEPASRIIEHPKTEYVIQQNNQPGRYTTYGGRIYDWEKESYSKCGMRNCGMCDFLYNACQSYRNSRRLINDISPESMSSDAEIEQALVELKLKPEAVLCDPGCGDARVLIRAVQQSGCEAIGIEIDPIIAADAQRRVLVSGLADRIQIICGDATKINLRQLGITAFYVYLYDDLLAKLKDDFLRADVVVSLGHRPPGLPVVKSGDLWVYRRGEFNAAI